MLRAVQGLKLLLILAAALVSALDAGCRRLCAMRGRIMERTADAA
jgi:hypothetical protein